MDFTLVFYVVHEVPDQAAFFGELASIVKPGGRLLVVEPPLHVSKREFAETIARAVDAGFSLINKPKIFLNKAALFEKEED